MKKRVSNIKQFIIFCLVGIINTILDISIYFFLHQVLALSVYIASPLTVILVMSFSYVMNSLFVFKHPLSRSKYIQFMVLTGVGVIIIQTLISSLFESSAQEFIMHMQFISSTEAKTFIADSITRISGIVFSLTWNFLFYKFVVFRYIDKKHEATTEETIIESME